MSNSTAPQGAYTPYRSSKRLSTASVQSFSSAPNDTPPRANTRALGLVRPSSGATSPPPLSINSQGSTSAHHQDIRAPQPYRPNGAGPSVGGSASQSAHHSNPASPPPSARPTPPPAAFPFHSVSPGNSPFPPSSPNRAQSPSTSGPPPRTTTPQASGAGGSGGALGRVRAPYHSSFQPQGVRRDRTEEFMSKRRTKGEGKKLDEGRLGRRLEKLVALHFPVPIADEPLPVPKASPLSTITAFGGSLRGKSAREIWTTVAGSKGEIERAEQGIVKWQDDADAVRCPICMASFGLKTRRHHCRLCGRVVCFLPPTPPTAIPEAPYDILPPKTDSPAPLPAPTRRERCSTFFTCEYEGVLVGEKKPVGIIVEVEPVEQDLSIGAAMSEVTAGGAPKEKDDRKKVRVCRDCLNTVMRQQMKTLPVRTPTWLKLYEVLVQLEKEIDEVLPEFQELVLGIQKPSSVLPSAHPSAATAQALRKRLLTTLASYDTISKRIRELPLNEGSLPGGSQDRLQRAVAARGTLFLGEKLGLLRSLGNLDELAGEGKNKKGKQGGKDAKQSGETTVKSLASLLAENGGAGDIVNEKVGPELEASGRLTVLLEQEALVRSYVEDANARRQFEDAASLKASLDELREEIARVRATLA